MERRVANTYDAHLAAVRRRAERLGGIAEIHPSPIAGKKYRAYLETGRTVDFGAKGYDDWLTHRDDARRANFRARMSGIRLKDGRRAIDVENSPAYLSYYLLW